MLYIIIYFLISYCFNPLFEVFKFLLLQTLNDRNTVLYTFHIIKVKLLFQKLCSLKKIVIYQFFLHLVACIHITVLSPCVYHQDKLCKKRPISYFNLSFIITEAKHLFPYLFPISNFYFVNDTFLSFLFITVVFISFLMHFFCFY